MAAYIFDPSNGVITPDTSTVFSQVESEWKNAFGEELVTTADTPQGVMIVAETISRQDTVSICAQNANQINPELAGGVFLDAICALTGLERRSAQPSVLTGVEVRGIPGTFIPAGSLAKTDADTVWALRTSLVLDNSGFAVGVFVAQDLGPIQCQIGALNTPVDMILGWESVYNPTAATIGVDQESDAELAFRRRITLARQTISTREAQLSALNDIDGVTSAVFRENISNNAAVIDGISMKPHSIWACVDGSTDEKVAESLLRRKTDGAGFNGAIEIQVTDPYSGQIYQVQFDRPEYVEPTIRVTCRQGTEAKNPSVEIPRAVENWASGKIPGDGGLLIGTRVSPFEIAGAINYFNPGYFVVRVEVMLGGTGYPDGIPITLLQRAKISASQVLVVVQ